MAPLLLLLLLLLEVFPSSSLAHYPPHTVTLRLSSSSIPPSSLLYDSFAQHFLLLPSSSSAPVSASDAGVLQTLTLSPSSSPPSALAIDRRQRRLLLASASPSPSLSAYDLSTPLPHPRLFLSPLPHSPCSLAVDPSTGAAFVAADLIWRVDSDGNVSVLSSSKAFAGGGSLDAITYVSKGFLLVAQGSNGKIFKVDPEDGTARLVLMNKNIYGISAMDMRSDGALVAISNGMAWILKSDDGWGEAVVYDKIDIGEGRQATGVAVRDGLKVYVLHGEEGGLLWKIEEVESEREKGGEFVGTLVVVGLGLAVFAYWRFQMRQLVSGMNKKNA